MIEEKTIDRNQIIGFLLIAGILIGLSWWTGSQEASTVPVEEKTVIESKESLDDFSMDSTSYELKEKVSVDSSFELSKEYILAVKEKKLHNRWRSKSNSGRKEPIKADSWFSK